MITAGRVHGERAGGDGAGQQGRPERDHIRVDGKLLKGAERAPLLPAEQAARVRDDAERPAEAADGNGLFRPRRSERLYPVGRLDYLSEGLLLMTNDGELANLLSKAGSGVEKTYLVKVGGAAERRGAGAVCGGSW